jgi:hypothetical protein
MICFAIKCMISFWIFGDVYTAILLSEYSFKYGMCLQWNLINSLKLPKFLLVLSSSSCPLKGMPCFANTWTVSIMNFKYFLFPATSFPCWELTKAAQLIFDF